MVRRFKLVFIVVFVAGILAASAGQFQVAAQGLLPTAVLEIIDQVVEPVIEIIQTDPATEPPATDPPTTQPPATDPPTTQPPATDPPTTQPPATDPPTTQPPATDPPTTQPPATTPPTTQPAATTPPPVTTPPPTTQLPTLPPAKTPTGQVTAPGTGSQGAGNSNGQSSGQAVSVVSTDSNDGSVPETAPTLVVDNDSEWIPIRACERSCLNWQLYQTNQTGDWEIFRLSEPGDLRDKSPNLSLGVGVDDIAPSRSPNGEWMAFTSNRDGNWEIYVARTDGTMVQRVTYNTTAQDLNPVWGANNYIVYESTRDGNWELYLVDVSTGVETRLTDDPANDTHPAWSPDGSKILFQSDRTGIWQLYRLDLATHNTVLISDGLRDDRDPAFSPNGQYILFRSYARGSVDSILYMMSTYDYEPQPISESAGDATHAVWSTDGALIAYQSDLDGDLDIYIYDVNSGFTRQLTNNTVADYAPSWRCDQPILIFNSDVTGDPNLFQAFALPMNAQPLVVEQQAEQMTFDGADDLYVSNAGAQEQVNQIGLASIAAQSSMPVWQADSPKDRPAFPAIDLAPGKADPNIARTTPWQSVNACTSVCTNSALFQTNQTGDWEVFLLTDLSSAGHSLVNLSQGYGAGVQDIAPSRSPDGKWIAFTTNRGGTWDIYVVDTTGNGIIRPNAVVRNDATDVLPIWSPNSQYLAYLSNRDHNWELYIVDVVTGVETRLTDSPTNDIHPAWSPDGSQILFQSDRSGTWQVYRIDMATNITTLLSDGTHSDHDPSFSADGQHILFSTYSDDSANNTLYLMSADGSTPQLISDPAGNATHAVWSNNGMLIAYQSDLDGDTDIYVYDVASGSTRKVTDNTVADYSPSWRCDQPTLIFNSDVTGDPNLFQVSPLPMDAPPVQVNADLNNQLTFNAADDLYPANLGDNQGDWDFGFDAPA
jgi:Tol biopolymer transport system component